MTAGLLIIFFQSFKSSFQETFIFPNPDILKKVFLFLSSISFTYKKAVALDSRRGTLLLLKQELDKTGFFQLTDVQGLDL